MLKRKKQWVRGKNYHAWGYKKRNGTLSGWSEMVKPGAIAYGPYKLKGSFVRVKFVEVK
ncbi:hypothetical protein ACFLQL_03005 [Verrucomicrobiota bacterium]